MVLDDVYIALSLFRQRKYDKCVELCNKLLVSSVHQKIAWELKMRAVTQRVYVDEIEADDGVEGTLLPVNLPKNCQELTQFLPLIPSK